MLLRVLSCSHVALRTQTKLGGFTLELFVGQLGKVRHTRAHERVMLLGWCDEESGYAAARQCHTEPLYFS